MPTNNPPWKTNDKRLYTRMLTLNKVALATKKFYLILFYSYDYGGSNVSGNDWCFCILLFWKTIDMAYCMAMVFMFLKVFLTVGMDILKLSLSSFIDGMCVVALALAVMTIRGWTFHP